MLPQLQQAAQDDPDDLDALAQLAIAYYQTQAYAEAESTYERMIAIEDRAEFHNNLANVYRDWQKSDQAVEQYQEAMDLDPTSALAYGNLAAMYWIDGQADKAKEIAKKGIENTAGPGREQLEALLARIE
jgi:protein O-GlcNAc transferase